MIDFPERENIPEKEQLESTYQAWMEAHNRYLDDITVLRADVILKFAGLECGDPHTQWARFELPNADSIGTDGDSYSSNSRDVVLILSRHPKAREEARPPSIRILTNEIFLTGNMTGNVLTQDISVDSESDAQILVDAITFGNGIMNIKGSFGVYYILGPQGELQLYNFDEFTRPLTFEVVHHAIGIDPETGDEIIVPTRGRSEPFGSYTHLSDATYALERAKSIITELKDITPTQLGDGQQLVRHKS